MVGLYNRRGSVIQMHSDDCSMLRTGSRSGKQVLVTEEEALSAKEEQGFSLRFCGCIKVKR